MIETSVEIKDLAAALALAQAEMEGAKKDAANPFFKSKYADLSSVWEACRGPLTKHGLSVVQTTSSDENANTVVTTMLLHSSGQWIRDTLTAKPKENSPQGIGSTITYLRRYALAAIAGVAPEDDDGEAAQGRGSSKVDALRNKFTAPAAGASIPAAVGPTPVGKIVTPTN